MNGRININLSHPYQQEKIVTKITGNSGFGTLVNHLYEGDNPEGAHLSPIYQTSTFTFPDVQTGADIFAGKKAGYAYTRSGNPNMTQLANKIAYLEGMDLIRQLPDQDVAKIVAGRVTSSGMAATSASVLGRIGAGDTALVQRGLYGNTFKFWFELAPHLGIKVHWVDSVAPADWERAFAEHPEARLAFVETPSNPKMELVDLTHLVRLAGKQDCWVFVDNTFATPYHQRPLTLGCDVVVHSTTKYLNGHGTVIGGAIVSRHVAYMTSGNSGVGLTAKMLGVAPSPQDVWLINVGLKTLEIRMQRHAENGLAVARFLDAHEKVSTVYYPGLKSNPYHALATQQMYHGFGGMLSFEIKGGIEAGIAVTNAVKIASLGVSLGNVDSLIQHPASMTHAAMPADEREKAGISDNLIRLSVGIENIEDIIADLDQALSKVG